MIIGVTGVYCSGKNLVSNIISKYGFKIIDVDLIGHRALEVKKEEIIEEFGDEIVISVTDKDGIRKSINRKALGRIVFSNPEKLKKLENIVHPWMIKEVKRLISSSKGNFVINAALLIEMCLFVLCDYVIGIDIDREIAIKRAVLRDKLDEGEAEMRLARQIPLKEKLHYVDIVIENNSSLEDLKKSVLNFLIKIGAKVK